MARTDEAATDPAPTHYHAWVEQYREDYTAFWFRCDCGQWMSVPR